MKRHFFEVGKSQAAKSLGGKVSQTVWKSGSEQDCRTLPTETVAGNAGFVYDWCRKYAMIHDNGMLYGAHSIAEKHRK